MIPVITIAVTMIVVILREKKWMLLLIPQRELYYLIVLMKVVMICAEIIMMEIENMMQTIGLVVEFSMILVLNGNENEKMNY